ncbi:MAG: 23S rRNA (guanosine(2251)-2'-O)-methyltransferase RlmB [Cyanobium sp.]
MSPRPDRRPDSRPERGGRRPAGGPPGRGPGRPGSSFRPAAGRRPRWGPTDGEGGSDRPRPRREGGPAQGEWTPRERPSDGGAGRRPDAPRFDAPRFDGPRFEGSRFEGRRPEAGRGDRRFERRPDRNPRFERRPQEGRPAAGAGAPTRPPAPGSRRIEIHRSGPRPQAGGSFRSAGAPPPSSRREFVRPGAAAPEPQGDHFAAAAPSDLIWGRHAVQAVLESERPVHRIWCTPEMRFSPRFLQLLREAKAAGVLVEEVTWARLGQISGGAVHQGIVLQPAAAATLDLASLIEGCAGIGEAPLLIALDGLTDPQNLGAIVRSAEALGAHGMVLPQRRSAGLNGSVAKVAAGALEHLPVARVVNLNRSLDTLRQEGYRVIGLASEGSVTLEEADLDGPLVVVTGSEGDGLSLLTRKHCDQLVRIPLRGTTPSLNASVATALLLYEIARRGWMEGLRGNSPAPRLMRPALPETQAALLEGEASEADHSGDGDPLAVAAASKAEAPVAPAALDLGGEAALDNQQQRAPAAAVDATAVDAAAVDAMAVDAVTLDAMAAAAVADAPVAEASTVAAAPAGSDAPTASEAPTATEAPTEAPTASEAGAVPTAATVPSPAPVPEAAADSSPAAAEAGGPGEAAAVVSLAADLQPAYGGDPEGEAFASDIRL